MGNAATTHDRSDLESWLARLRVCDGKEYDCTIVVWEAAQAIAAEVDRLRAEVSALRLQRDAALAEVESARKAHERLNFAVEQALGRALFGVGADGLPLWGEHTAETLIVVAVREISKIAQRRAIERALNAEG